MKKHHTHIGIKGIAGLFYGTLGVAIQGALQVFSIMILARLLSPAEFGVVGAALLVVKLAGIFSQLGVAPAIVQTQKLSTKHITSAFSLSLAFGVVFTLTIYALKAPIAIFFDMPDLEEVVAWYSPVFIFMGISVTSEALIQRDFNFKRIVIFDSVSYAIGYCGVSIILALCGYGLWALVAGSISQHIIRSVGLMLSQPHPVRWLPNLKASRELLRFGAGQTLARIANYGGSSSDKAIVGKFIGASALGEYGRAHQLIMPITLLGTVVDKVLFTSLSRVQDQPAKLRVNYRRSVTMITLLYFPLGCLIMILAETIVSVVLGPKWEGVADIVQILAVSVLYRGVTKVSDSIAKSTGSVYRRALVQWFYAAVVCIATFLVADGGVINVAKAFAVAGLLQAILMVTLGCSISGLRWTDIAKSYVPGVLVGAVLVLTAGLVKYVCEYYGLIDVLTLALVTLASSSVYISIIVYRKGKLVGRDGIWMYDLISRAFTRRRDLL